MEKLIIRQVKLTADHPGACFATPTIAGQQPDLSHMHSTGSVNARVSDAHGKSQAIQCQALDLSTAAVPQTRKGEASRYINRMIADGQVRAYDADSEIRAGHLDAAASFPLRRKCLVVRHSGRSAAGGRPASASACPHRRARSRQGWRGGRQRQSGCHHGRRPGLRRVILTRPPPGLKKGQNITVGNIPSSSIPKTQALTKFPAIAPCIWPARPIEIPSPTDVAWTGGMNADLNLQNAIEN